MKPIAVEVFHIEFLKGQAIGPFSFQLFQASTRSVLSRSHSSILSSFRSVYEQLGLLDLETEFSTLFRATGTGSKSKTPSR
jgi:hypothetical protein